MSLPPSYFDDLYERDADPWRLASRWYEERKYALTLAALSRPRYRSAFEPGCSVGVLTAGLARRCDALLAWDVAAPAIEAARARTADEQGTTVACGQVPHDWPEGRFDLIVVSELGYYLSTAELDRVAERVSASLEPGGELVLVHWRHPVADYPLRGDDVHARFTDRAELTGLAHHHEADFLLDVLVRTPPAADSVAAREGLC